jgi:hypothetical protein
MVMVTKIAAAALSSFWSLPYLSFLKLIGSLDGSEHNPKSSKSNNKGMYENKTMSKSSYKFSSPKQ